MGQMVEQVARLVANRLAGGGDIFLPHVGSLFVVHQGAEQLSKRWIQPPYRRVDFTSQERGESLPDMIARAASCDAETARTVYDRWLEQTRKEDTLTIAGVGTLTYKTFASVPEFERRLNPQGRAPMRLHRSHGLDWVLVLGIVAIVAAAIVVSHYLMQKHFVGMQQPVEEVTAAPETTAVVGVPEAGESVAADAPVAARGASTTGADAVADAPSVPNGTSTEAGAPAETTVASAQSQELPRLAAGRHYVVMGVFQTRENAEHAVKQLAVRYPDWNCQIYRYGSRFMVTCYASEDENTARNFVRSHRHRYADLWVHSAR